MKNVLECIGVIKGRYIETKYQMKNVLECIGVIKGVC